MTELRRQFGAPMHHQLFAVLRSAIMSGRFAYGETLPSEETLRETYDVSRTTVRRALLSLEQEGLIERRQGRGTRVVFSGDSGAAVSRMSSYIEGIGRLDRKSTMRLHAFEFVRPSAEVREALGPGELVLRIVRVRSLDDRPLWHLTNFMPEILGRALDRALIETNTLFEALRLAGSPCHHAEELIGATLADPEIAGLLEINVGAPLLESSRVMVDAQDRPISFQITLIPPERRRYRIRVEADDRGTLPAAGEPGLLAVRDPVPTSVTPPEPAPKPQRRRG